MPEKFTIEKHEDRMRRILTPVDPTQRPDVIRDLLDRIRGGAARLPKRPKLPRLPGIGEPKL